MSGPLECELLLGLFKVCFFLNQIFRPVRILKFWHMLCRNTFFCSVKSHFPEHACCNANFRQYYWL
jgi:hypothetical protein